MKREIGIILHNSCSDHCEKIYCQSKQAEKNQYIFVTEGNVTVIRLNWYSSPRNNHISRDRHLLMVSEKYTGYMSTNNVLNVGIQPNI